MSVRPLLVAALVGIVPSVQAAPSCRDGFPCPGAAGRVDVTLAGFDGSAASKEAGHLDADEIQCALDCLDGDPDPDHVLAGPAPPRTATPVRGGSVVFDPSVSYRVQRSLRLPAATWGMLRIDGQGARLTVDRKDKSDKTPITVFERRAPAGANNCDAEIMTLWSMMWIIENVSIAGDGSEQDVGIALHGTNSLTIRNCWLASLGTGIDLRFALVPQIDHCYFANSRRHDVYLGSGDAECGPGQSCFPSCTTGAAIFTKSGSDTRTLVESGCNSAVVRHCRFALNAQQLSSIRVRNSRSVVIDTPVFDGYPGRHAIHYSQAIADDFTVRDMYFETGTEREEALVRFDGGSRLLVDGLHVVAGVPVTVVDASENPGARVVVRGMSWMPKDIRFRNGSNPWKNEWRFEDVSAGDMASPARWVGGPPPRELVIDRILQADRPLAGVARSLTIPVGSPPSLGEKLEDGQIWIDPETKRLMFCCDEHGRPKPAGR